MYFYDDERLTIFEVGQKKPVALFTSESDFWKAVNEKYHALPLFDKKAFYSLRG